jgi:hypothetical protein
MKNAGKSGQRESQLTKKQSGNMAKSFMMRSIGFAEPRLS